MTKAEREARAVADHRCPRCRSQQHFLCRRFVGTKLRYLSHPHQERLDLVVED